MPIIFYMHGGHLCFSVCGEPGKCKIGFENVKRPESYF
jgi:hypothetical protein